MAGRKGPRPGRVPRQQVSSLGPRPVMMLVTTLTTANVSYILIDALAPLILTQPSRVDVLVCPLER